MIKLVTTSTTNYLLSSLILYSNLCFLCDCLPVVLVPVLKGVAVKVRENTRGSGNLPCHYS